MARLYVGTSGWNYPAWRGDFFPNDLPHADELGYIAERLDSVEINASFYSLQRTSTYRRWVTEVPADFVFAVKGGRYLTHMKKLRNVEQALANFFASGLLALDAQLGPILWQLPANLRFDAERIQTFLGLLPRSTADAARVACDHDDKVPDPLTASEVDLPLRHALEVRHDSFTSTEAIDLIGESGVALVVADSASKWPKVEQVTSDFMYVRLHGAEELYTSGYGEEVLQSWAERIKTWVADGLDVYVYFDNDAAGRAPHDARALQRLSARAL